VTQDEAWRAFNLAKRRHRNQNTTQSLTTLIRAAEALRPFVKGA
jgi:hypothetical protein